VRPEKTWANTFGGRGKNPGKKTHTGLIHNNKNKKKKGEKAGGTRKT